MRGKGLLIMKKYPHDGPAQIQSWSLTLCMDVMK